MTSGLAERYDFFLSRRGSVAAIAREVTDVLLEKGYKVRVEDYDFELGASFIEDMHEAIVRSRDLIILLTGDYLRSPHTRKEFTSFEAQRLRSVEERHVVVLRCEDVPLEGLLADVVYQDLVGVADAEERKRRIIAAAERQSQAAPPPPRPFIDVPLRIASFTGRTEELDRLDAILIGEKPAAVTHAVGRVAVQGMGGVGKTSLAIEYAHRFRGLYAGVCWCPAETREGLLSSLASLAVTLRAATAEQANVENAAKAALRRLAEQRATWLLIYDNVPEPKDIAELLPSACARVLITSRFSDWGEFADEVALDVLPLEEAIVLLESRAGRSDAAGARVLAEALGSLPLALDHAAAYCRREKQMSFADYAAEVGKVIDEWPRGSVYPRSIGATFNLNIVDAIKQIAAAEALMGFLAHCAPERIPMTLIEGAVDDENERRTALAALIEVSLVKHDPFEDGTPAVVVHRLVQAVALARAQTKGSPKDAVGRLISWLVNLAQSPAPGSAKYAWRLIARLLAVYPEKGFSDPQSWAICAQLTPHLTSVLAAVSPDLAEIGEGHRIRKLLFIRKAVAWTELYDRAGCYFHGRGLYLRGAAYLKIAYGWRVSFFGRKHPYTKAIDNHLALAYRDLSDFNAIHGLTYFTLTHPNRPRKGSPDMARFLNAKGLVSMEEGSLAEARQLFERALAIDEKALGSDHPDTARSLNNLALVLRDEGDFVWARQLMARALAIDEKAFGPEHPNTARSLNNLALVLRERGAGDLVSARRLVERALAIDEKALGSEHPDTAKSLNNLALLLQDQGNTAGARPLVERAIAIYDKTVPYKSPVMAQTLNSLGGLLKSQGDFAAALALFARALSELEGTLGPEHPKTNAVRRDLSGLLPLIDDPTKALALGETALAAHDKVLKQDRRDSARVTADALDALGRTDEAKALRDRYEVTEPEKPQSS